MHEIIERLRTNSVLPVKDVADALGVSLGAGYDAVERGEWPHIRIGKTIRVLTAPLCERLENQVAAATAPKKIAA